MFVSLCIKYKKLLFEQRINGTRINIYNMKTLDNCLENCVGMAYMRRVMYVNFMIDDVEDFITQQRKDKENKVTSYEKKQLSDLAFKLHRTNKQAIRLPRLERA